MDIIVKRYPDPKAVGFTGYVEDKTRAWIVFVDLKNQPTVFINRDPETGAVLPDDPAGLEVAITSIREEQARRAAWVAPVEGVHYPVFAGEPFAGYVAAPRMAVTSDLRYPPALVAAKLTIGRDPVG